MNAASIPTPFDISEVPHIAWVPSSFDWVFFLGIFLLGLITTVLLRRRYLSSTGMGNDQRIAAMLLREIDMLAAQPSPGSNNRLIRLARRVVEYVSGNELTNLSPTELLQLAESAQPIPNIEGFRRIVRLVAEFELANYAPKDLNNPVTLDQPRLASELRAYINDLKVI